MNSQFHEKKKAQLFVLHLTQVWAPFSMIWGSFGEPVEPKIGLGASCWTLGPPKGLLENPKGAMLVDLFAILDNFG